jgi:hypothetical protein
MNRKTRKGLGAILAGVGVTTLLGVMSGTGIVRADDVDPQDDIPGDNAETVAAVDMKQRCEWYVTGVPSAITLYPSGASDGEVYDGSRYTLSVDLTDIAAWTDGNLAETPDSEAHDACTFFGEQTGIAVTGSWSGSSFTAAADDDSDVGTPDVADSNMDFSASDDLGTDPLTFGITEGTCRTPGNDGSGLSQWAVGGAIYSSALTGSIMSLDVDNATSIPQDAAGGNDKCNTSVTVSASIPAGQTPLYAGKRYSFSGPTFTTEIEIDTNRGL